jgi:hypothetical protein
MSVGSFLTQSSVILLPLDMVRGVALLLHDTSICCWYLTWHDYASLGDGASHDRLMDCMIKELGVKLCFAELRICKY